MPDPVPPATPTMTGALIEVQLSMVGLLVIRQWEGRMSPSISGPRSRDLSRTSIFCQRRRLTPNRGSRRGLRGRGGRGDEHGKLRLDHRDLEPHTNSWFYSSRIVNTNLESSFRPLNTHFAHRFRGPTASFQGENRSFPKTPSVFRLVWRGRTVVASSLAERQQNLSDFV